MRLLLTLGVLAGLLAAASPAAADDVDGVVRASAVSPSSAFGFKSATAICPLGKRLMGAGFEIAGANNTVVVDDLMPNTGLTTVAGTAYGPNDNSWTLTTYGICTFFQPGLQRVSVDSPGNGGDESATATCPGTKVLVGAGYGISGALGAAKVYRMRPNGGTTTAPTSVTVAAAGTPAAYTLTAHADCADASDGLVPGLVRRQATSASSTAFNRGALASCVAGEVLIGTGYEIHDAPGMTVANDLRPNGNATTGPTNVMVNAYKTQDFFTNWSVSAYALCAIQG
jgi:hypothetical protein